MSSAEQPERRWFQWIVGGLCTCCLAAGAIILEDTRREAATTSQAITGRLDALQLTVTDVQNRQLTQMLPKMERVEERLATIDRFCCSEIPGRVKADVMLDDDPPKAKRR